MNNEGEQVDCVEDGDEKQAVYARLQALEQAMECVNGPEDLEALEREIRECTDRLGALVLQTRIQALVDSPEQQAKEKELIGSWPGRLRSEGYEIVRIRTMGGFWIRIRVRYYRRACHRRSGKRHKGVYAALVLLGIHERCTPGLAAMVSAWSSLLSSFDEVRQVLVEQGVKMDVKMLRKLTYRYAERARVVQQAGLLSLGEDARVAGRRVVVSSDGGRVRLRENKRGPKTKKRRTRYKGAWREPKLLIIYVVDAQGKLEKSFAPLIDGTFQGPDALYQLIQGYLESLGIEQADEILFVADGAHWIWNRIPDLVAALSLDSERVHELIDFYHAVEHLGTVAALRKSWSAKERKAWVRKQRRLLLKGQVEQVVKAVQAICRGRNSKAITTERDYFVRNQSRMAYPTLKALRLPIGSGAIESAVRRVINLRLKGPCIFWYKENAEKMLMLRSYYKAGRWSLLKQMANSHLSLLAA
jgi:hypothetical protein